MSEGSPVPRKLSFRAPQSARLADEEGALLLSSLNGTDITTDLRAIRAACTADFMPLKDLYESGTGKTCSPVSATASPEVARRDGFAHAPAQGACVRHAPGGSHAGPGTGNTQVAEAGPRIGMGHEKNCRWALSALHPPERRKRLQSIRWRTDAEFPLTPVAYIALALRTEEVISRVHAVLCSHHGWPHRHWPD